MKWMMVLGFVVVLSFSASVKAQAPAESALLNPHFLMEMAKQLKAGDKAPASKNERSKADGKTGLDEATMAELEQNCSTDRPGK